MALRVLLADESHTIKKVFQLALQDFAVEVRPVNIGLDVLSVAKKFKPDIIFADVLLQKKSGYEVCAEIKNDPELMNTPVILMWSGFMELDEDKVQASKANSKLEKPFDVNSLRKIVQEFVEKTKTQRLSGFLTFPDRPDFEESKPKTALPPPTATSTQTPPPPPKTEESPQWNMESFEPIDQFKPVSLTKAEVKDQDLELIGSQADEAATQWKQKSLGDFKVQSDETTDDEIPIDYMIPEEKMDTPRGMLRTGQPPPPPSKPILQWDTNEDSKVLRGGAYVIDSASQTFEYKGPSNPSIPSATKPPPVPPEVDVDLAVESIPSREASGPSIPSAELERMIQERAQAMIEEVVWKVVPELASRIIERELQKLLSEAGPP